MKNLIPLDIEKGEHIYALKILVEELRTKFDAKIVLKNDSRLMRFIGRAFSFVGFNKTFMSNFFTTVGDVVYAPEEYREVVELTNRMADGDSSAEEELKTKKHEAQAKGLLSTLFHEYVHINDDKNSFLRLYSVAYLTPQIYSLLGVAFLVASFFNPYCLIGVPIFALYALPLGSHWRCHYESRGYATNVVCLYLVYGFRIDRINPNAFMKHFNNSSYYWMLGHPKLTMPGLHKRASSMVREHLDGALLSLSNNDAVAWYDNLEHVYRICSKAKKGSVSWD